MSPLKCCLCFKHSHEFPEYFKPMLTDFRQLINKLQSWGLNGAEVDKLIFCKSCWNYFMRIHQLDRELHLKKQASDAHKTFLSTKIRQVQSSVTAKGNNAKSCKDLEVQSSASKDNGDNDSNVFEISLDEDCETTEVTTTDNVAVSVPQTEPTEATSDETSTTASISEPAKAKPDKFIFTYENKWLPKGFALPKFSYNVKQISTTDFLFMDKYPFHGTEFGFKCGLCRVVSTFNSCKGAAAWDNLVNHIKKWHMGDRGACKTKTTTQRCIQVGPNHFQYGKCSFEQVDKMYQCGECGVLKPQAKSSIHRTSNILKHILVHHEKLSRECICEHCGLVYKNLNSLRGHKQSVHDNREGQFPCRECDKSFVSRSKAASHEYQIHRKRRGFICEICGKAFTQKGQLGIHVASVHKKEKMKCDECGKIFGSQCALNVHRYSHKGKKYSCDICGMDFTQGYSVTRHKKTAHPE